MIAAIDARKSTDQSGVSEDQKSVTRQIEHATAYALKKGWTISESTSTATTGSAVRSSATGALGSCA